MAVLKAAKIRGVESTGMVCSEKELGLSEAHEGILELPADAPVGKPLGDYYGDTIFELEVTPNRPDHMSMLGIAWEVAAQTRVKVKEPERIYTETGTQAASQQTSVTIEDKDLCPRYLAGIVERVKVGPSPAWMQERLTRGGHAADQQRCRHNELRHAGDGPAPPRLRLPQARRRPHRRPAREGRASGSRPSTRSTAS